MSVFQLPNLTRRRLLTQTAGMTAAALASSILPPNLRRVLAAAPPSAAPSMGDIKHVVCLMQENRSFDHYFGTIAGVRGFNDPTAMALPTGKSVFHQPDEKNADGFMLPFHLDTLKTSAQKLPSTSHAWAVQHDSWNGGKMDRWLRGPSQGRRRQSALCHGLSHPRRYSVSICVGRGVHDLRRLPLFCFGPHLAEPFVLDDRNHRSRRTAWRPDHQQHASQQRTRHLHLDNLRRTIGASRGELESLSAGRQLRVQRA